jgi:hypothetical protein
MMLERQENRRPAVAPRKRPPPVQIQTTVVSLSRAGVRPQTEIDVQLPDRSAPGPGRSRNWF